MSATLPLAALALPVPAPAFADDLRAAVAADLPALMALYRELHANPELSFQEVRTAARLAGEVRKAGFQVTEKVGRTGVVAVMRNGPGPTVLIRTDMDALPVVEQTGLPYASKVRATPASGIETGVMHACGHDTHMTAWVETARLLSARKASWSGTLVMIAQPAEEIGEGARAMLADGLYARFPKPSVVLAFHDDAGSAAGVIGLSGGYTWANADTVDLTVRGVGGHGAFPQMTKDPIVLASAIVMRLQTLVSRESDPVDPVVITVGSFHAGSKHNIISEEAKLQLTVRSYSDESRQRLIDGIRRVADGEARASGIPEDRMPLVSVQEPYTRSNYNSPDLTEQLAEHLRSRFGNDRMVGQARVMAAEDFAEYRRADPAHIRSVQFRVGGVPSDAVAAAKAGGKPLPSLHSPFWAPDAEAVIATAAEALTSAAIRLMPKSGADNQSVR